MQHITTNLEELIPEFEKLLSRDISSLEDLKDWIDDKDIIQAKLQNDFAWRYIKQTTHTDNQEYKRSYESFLEEIYPYWIQISDKLGRKLVETSVVEDLPSEYFNFVRSTKHAIELYREENVPLIAQEQAIESEYSQIVGALSIDYDGKTLTMQQAAQFLKNPDRQVRKEVFELMEARRKLDVDQFDDILSRLVQIRTQIAQNAGFESYTQYAYAGRFDYTQEDVHEFHRSIQEVITPLGKELFEIRKQKLGLDTLKPYDFQIGLFSMPSGDVFSSQEEMLTKLKDLYTEMDEEFATHIGEMQAQGLLDLESRPGKASNGYNYPFAKSQYGFIFMNDMLDMRARFTLVHEGGHALHHRLTSKLEVESHRRTPSELAEVASMAMELFTIDDLDKIGLDELAIRAALEEKLSDDVLMFAWISKVDLFQEWLYDNPHHTLEERHEYWLELERLYPLAMRTYDTDAWSPDYQDYLKTFWQRQMHIFANPFYYIEYGIAQLASIQLYQQWLQDRDLAISNYKAILESGYTRSISDTLALGGVNLDLSKQAFEELMEVMMEKYREIIKNG